MAGVGAFGNPQAAMEAAVLVHNVTRIVQVPYVKKLTCKNARFLVADSLRGAKP